MKHTYKLYIIPQDLDFEHTYASAVILRVAKDENEVNCVAFRHICYSAFKDKNLITNSICDNFLKKINADENSIMHAHNTSHDMVQAESTDDWAPLKLGAELVKNAEDFISKNYYSEKRLAVYILTQNNTSKLYISLINHQFLPNNCYRDVELKAFCLYSSNEDNEKKHLYDIFLKKKKPINIEDKYLDLCKYIINNYDELKVLYNENSLKLCNIKDKYLEKDSQFYNENPDSLDLIYNEIVNKYASRIKNS